MKIFHTYDKTVPLLLDGEIGILPTDTIYGLVARAVDMSAVARFYTLKQREHKPGTVIAASVEQLAGLGVPKHHLDTVGHLWPGPLSIEIPLGESLRYLHQDTGRQAFRVVADHKVRELLELTGPLVTTSANQPGQPGSTTIREAMEYFGNTVDFYVDLGELTDRTPSTIVRIEGKKIEVIRQGAIRLDQIIN